MADTKVKSIIEDNPVVVFGKTYCQYCRATKALLTEQGAKFETVELDQVDDGSDMHNALKSSTGQTTVPYVFINQQLIGGNSDLQAKKRELPSLLKVAGAL